MIDMSKYCNCEKDDAEYDCCMEDVQSTLQKMVRVFQLFEKDHIKDFHFTPTQGYTLMELKKSTQLTMNELSERMNLDTSTMTRIIDKLVTDDLVLRSKLPSDRRVVMVSLTEKGNASAEDLAVRLDQYYRNIIEKLPRGHIQEVLQSTLLLMEAFEKN